MKFLFEGKNVFTLRSLDIRDELPVGTFRLSIGESGPYLTQIDDFKIPEKVYSNDTNFIKHVLGTWDKIDRNLGVGLVGKKGLGKSFTASILAKSVDLPIICIDRSSLFGGMFNYLNNFKQDFVLFIDEFEKIIPVDNRSDEADHGVSITQESLLSFLDPGYVRNNKIFFIITSNEDYKISDFLKSRPSRLRYYKNYENLDDSVIIEIIDDLLEKLDHKKDLLENLNYEQLNIDVLIQIIKEINMCDQPYSVFKSFFNYKITGSCNVVFKFGERTSGSQSLPMYSGHNIIRTLDYQVYLGEDIYPEDIREGEEATFNVIVTDFEGRNEKTVVKAIRDKRSVAANLEEYARVF